MAEDNPRHKARSLVSYNATFSPMSSAGRSIARLKLPGRYAQAHAENISDWGHDPQFLRQLVQVGDTYGYDSLWLSDRIVGRQLSLEPLVALAMVAAYSDRLKFGTSVLALPIRHPVVLAKH